jgi:outer membrane PBP1 activator LpoA protein
LLRGADIASAGAIAILLPAQGRFASAAKAVRDGISAAHRAAGRGDQAQLRDYDSSDPAQSPNLARRAAAEGAKLIIGPLQREAVERLAAEAELPVATLALNRSRSGRIPPPNLFQFSLDPEDEAAAVAMHAQAKGHRSALLVYPGNAWGLRLASAFREAWGARGGVIEAGHVYEPDALDRTDGLDGLLQVAQYGSGPSGMGTKADFVFAVGTARQIAAITSQIRGRIGDRLPVFTTSHVNDGRMDSSLAQDLAGLYFVDIPRMIAAPGGEGPALRPSRSARRGLQNDYHRLFAMGVDAYRLAPLVTQTRGAGMRLLEGQTGALWIDDQRRIRRDLLLAQIGRTYPQ